MNKKSTVVILIIVMCLIFGGICLIFSGLSKGNDGSDVNTGTENEQTSGTENTKVDNSRLPITISKQQRAVANEAAFVDYLASELKSGNNTVISEYFALDAFNERGYYFLDDDMSKLDEYMKTYQRDLQKYDEYMITSVTAYEDYSIVSVVMADREVANQDIIYNYDDMDVLYFTVFENDEGVQVIPFLLSQTVYYLYDIGAIEIREM